MLREVKMLFMRTSEQITAEIKVKFGFIPPFFNPAIENPQVLENLWQQTLSAYINNPLSPEFKEKLSVYLSRFCAVPYCLICHSCSLRSLGIKAQEILELLESTPPTETEIDHHLFLLATSEQLTFLPGAALEDSLLYCAIFIALEREQADYCRNELRRILGVNYQHLTAFIAYVKTCHEWIAAHPEVAYEGDQRVQDNFNDLLADEPGLTDFFDNYWQKVKGERQSRAEYLAQITERQRNEAALRKAAAQNLCLARAVTSASDGILITDSNQPDNPIIYTNPAFSRISGYQPEEIIGQNWRFLQGTDEQAIAQINNAIAQRREVKVTMLNYRQNNQPFWSELKISPVFSEAGELLNFIGIQTDITERQQAEIALRQQIERERLVLEIQGRIRQSLNLEEILSTTVAEVQQFLQAERVFIYRFQPDWSGDVIFESVNSGWLPLLGMHIKDSFFGKADGRELYRQGRIQATDDIYTANLAKCHLDLLVELQIRANLVVPILQGQQLWGLLVANHCSQPRQWQQLEIDLLKQLATQVAIAIQQSTLFQQAQTQLIERQRAEQKICEQAALLDIATDAIRVQDLETQILFWNKGAERLYGWQAVEALGKNAKELLYKSSSLQMAAAQQIVQDKGEWYGELHQVTKFGKEIIVESRWTLVRDEVGKPKSVLVVNTDITQKKQLEAQFLRAQRMESIGTLAGGIAHDLNNVLAPILMSAQLLQLKTTDERTQQLLQTVEANAKRGGALVKQVLSFARGVEGQHTILQVRHLISEIKHIAMQTFSKSIQFYTDIAPELWSVSGDTTQLHQVLMNLCVNARDAMPNGGVLRISASNLLIDQNYAQMNLEANIGAYILITVSDTGTGIPPEIVDRIFEPFFTTKEQGKGTGLGLATVIGIIKSHGGFVDVYSEVGQGTQFKVYLPAVEGTTTQPEKDMELPTGNGELILVVDDESAICEVTKTSLLTYDYKVLTASDGIEAIALYAQHKHEISLVLIDMMMPSMDGPTTIRTLQKLNPQVKIIAVSGLDASDKVNTALSAGAKAFLSKPYTAQELLKIINSVLNMK